MNCDFFCLVSLLVVSLHPSSPIIALARNGLTSHLFCLQAALSPSVMLTVLLDLHRSQQSTDFFPNWSYPRFSIRSLFVFVILVLTSSPTKTTCTALATTPPANNNVGNNMIARTAPAALAVRVVSYNVLSSHLASPSHFSALDPDHLQASNRLPKVLGKLEEELTSSKDKNVIFCLQEVSQDWAGAFHTWFANRGYHLVTGLYGKKFNGYMGVALAYPTSSYETLDVDISRLADKRPDGWPVEPEPSTVKKVTDFGMKALTFPFRTTLNLFRTPPKPPVDHWHMSKNRFNVLLTATLKDKITGNTFCIGNYHMPCAFFAPMVMTIHSELAAQHVQSLASSRSAPYILAGDWNITPDSPTYELLTTGKLSKDDPTYPSPQYGMEWACTMKEPLRSAYAVSKRYDGEEPNFTNYARVKEQDPFIDTLDYIFLSKDWRVIDVKPIVHRDVANGPYPNNAEPSDHVLIAADLEMW